MVQRIVLAALSAAVFATPVMAQDAAAGKAAFRQCQACHVVDAETNRVGPHLVDIVGRPVASVEGFEYSEAMQAFGEGDKVWDEAALKEFLANPRSVVEGTRMAFAGIKDETRLSDLIAYLTDPSAAE
ncbi:c-type cytochrome [Pararhizobium haloflavum]|uniref:c-type cytochrome n=1 Tax=Pararhizobium haloflavum TaxID=2037914 RepID=UPI000C1752F4|nr:cytochrome c family protein [Pararhizobium haloflavum]